VRIPHQLNLSSHSFSSILSISLPLQTKSPWESASRACGRCGSSSLAEQAMAGGRKQGPASASRLSPDGGAAGKAGSHCELHLINHDTLLRAYVGEPRRQRLQRGGERILMSPRGG
jgi:hypothetical protein